MSQVWGDYAITGVRYERYGSQRQWKRIVAVEARRYQASSLGASETWTRQQVVNAIKNGRAFVTAVQGRDSYWYAGEDVRVVRIDGAEYIRTDPNDTPDDNLGSLPEF